MCDKLVEGDSRYEVVKSYSKPSCLAANDQLQHCLDASGKDWRKCQTQVAALSQCMKETKEVDKG